jgi:hypothetical protein
MKTVKLGHQEAEYFCQNQLSYEDIQYLSSDLVVALEIIGKNIQPAVLSFIGP